MPSPFPGMDPYLEGALWTTVHFSLSAEMVRQLAPKLRPRYLVLPAERFVTETPESVAISTADIYPDVSVAETRTVTGSTQRTAIAPAPLELATIIPTPIPHVTIEIRDTANRQLVTAIEVLSPTNKRGEGREEDLAKRRRLLLSSAHLLEINLLLPGDPDVQLQLQGALTTIYDACGYDLAVDYTRPPEVPLSPQEAAWADS